MKILIVDDDPGIVEVLTAFLAQHGHEAIAASTGKECLRRAAIEQPSLVLLDIRLPDKDGVSVLKELKEIDRQLAVVMVTAFKDAERVIDAFREGAMDCLLKPINFDYLLTNILSRVLIRDR